MAEQCWGLCSPSQIYTRSVIDPIPAPAGDSCADSASKAGDKQKKKTKMSDEDIMEKLRRCLRFRSTVGLGEECDSFALTWLCVQGLDSFVSSSSWERCAGSGGLECWNRFRFVSNMHISVTTQLQSNHSNTKYFLLLLVPLTILMMIFHCVNVSL